MATQELDTQYKELRQKAEMARDEVLFGLLDELKFHPDALRNAIGSVAFRRLEEYRSYEEQAEAAFTEWLGSLGA
ncbi:hypothetical protein [Fibrobacter sp.]|uniref:hypothetical protein n=1 Tax=Fibrobacter sp. TaxID=35828 RepID=UPI0025BA359B|nr:hypothetical protein [Fibrobacter sp.]MBR4009092.1 hypothetical protein [Fibrobacter sp.]